MPIAAAMGDSWHGGVVEDASERQCLDNHMCFSSVTWLCPALPLLLALLSSFLTPCSSIPALRGLLLAKTLRTPTKDRVCAK